MLVGRDAHLDLLADLLADDVPAVVVGESGIGKTSVLRAVAVASGRLVLEGGALATLAWVPYLALERALGRPARGRDAAAVAADVADAVGDGVLVADDLQWADEQTLRVLPLLAGRVGLLAAVRSGGEAAAAVTARLREAGFRVHALPALDRASSDALARRVRPELGAAELDELARRTGGNPLLIAELAASGEPTQALRFALAARLRRSDESVRRAFTLLALAGGPLPAGALEASVGVGVADRLIAAELAVRDGQGLAVRHALLAEVATADLDADERVTRHTELAALLDEPGRRAHHLLHAGQRSAARDAALAAAAAATRPGERAAHLGMAAELADGPHAARLQLEAAQALAASHDWPRLSATLDALTTDDPEIRTWAAVLRARGAWAAGETDLLRAAVAEVPTGAEGTGAATLLEIERCRLPIFVDGRADDGVVAAREALARATATGVGVARARYFLGTALMMADAQGWDAELAEAADAARVAGDLDTEFVATINRIAGHESGGSQDTARELARTAIARARELGLGDWEYPLRAMVVNLDFHAGDYAAALAEADDLLGLPVERRSVDMLVEISGLCLVDIGRIAEAERRIAEHRARAVDDYRGAGSLYVVDAEAAFWGGSPRRAVELADRYLDAMADDPLNAPFGHVVRAWSCWALGEDPGEAVTTPPRSMLAAVGPEISALRLWFRDEPRAAADAFDAAAAAWTGWHRRGVLRCRWGAAEALRRAGDRDDAVARLTALEPELEHRGMRPLLGRVHRSLRAAGVHRAAPRADTPGRLTGREREVLQLAADGLTDTQIATRLGLARRTVQAHVASASIKLGATTRTQAALLARRDRAGVH